MGSSSQIRHSRGGFSTKIHVIVDFYGYSVYLLLTEEQRNNIAIAVPLLKHVELKESFVLAGKGYNNNKLIDDIYNHDAEPIISSRKGAKFERHCDWWYKERHLVEKIFLKRKVFQRITICYDKYKFTYMGFLYLASILLWIK